jgi:hypothetical protein
MRVLKVPLPPHYLDAADHRQYRAGRDAFLWCAGKAAGKTGLARGYELGSLATGGAVRMKRETGRMSSRTVMLLLGGHDEKSDRPSYRGSAGRALCLHINRLRRDGHARKEYRG